MLLWPFGRHLMLHYITRQILELKLCWWPLVRASWECHSGCDKQVMTQVQAASLAQELKDKRAERAVARANALALRQAGFDEPWDSTASIWLVCSWSGMPVLPPAVTTQMPQGSTALLAVCFLQLHTVQRRDTDHCLHLLAAGRRPTPGHTIAAVLLGAIPGAGGAQQ